MPAVTRRRGQSRIVALLLGVTLTVAALGWLIVSETPAAQQMVEKIKPYDPYE